MNKFWNHGIVEVEKTVICSPQNYYSAFLYTVSFWSEVILDRVVFFWGWGWILSYNIPTHWF